MNQHERFYPWFSQNKLLLLRWSLAVSYVWFGALKFFPGLSPADGLAKDTIRVLTFGLIPDDISIILLAIWEVSVGLILFTGFWLRPGLKLAVAHIVLTFMPLFFFPEVSFTQAPYGFTLVGQYIVKNLVFLVAFGILLTETRQREAGQ